MVELSTEKLVLVEQLENVVNLYRHQVLGHGRKTKLARSLPVDVSCDLFKNILKYKCLKFTERYT